MAWYVRSCSPCASGLFLFIKRAGAIPSPARRELREGKQAQQNQLAFSHTAFQRQLDALQGLSGARGGLRSPILRFATQSKASS